MSSVIVSSAYDTSGNGGRKIVRLSNNWIVTATSNGGTGGSEYLNLYVSKDNGQTWALLAYNNYLGISQGFAIASSGTKIYIFSVGTSTTTAVYFQSFDAATWTTGAALNNASNPATGVTYATPDTSQTATGSGCSLVIDGNGKLWAVWCSKNSTYPNSFNIRVSSSTDGGTTWATPTQCTNMNTAGANNTNPCIVVNSSNTPFIFYQDTNNNIRCNIGAVAYTQTSSIKIVYGGSSYTQENPCAVVDSNDVIHVVWDGKDATYPTAWNVRYSKSSDGGSTWSAQVLLTTGNSYSQDMASITVDPNNNLYVLFQGVDPAVNASYYNIRKIVNNAGTWGSISTITSNTTNHAQNVQTLWSKFNMNSSDAVRYMWVDDQVASVKYDSITLNSPPNAPTYSYLTSSGSTVNGRPKFILNVSDPDSGNTIQNTEIQVASDSGFTSIVWDAQYGTDSGYGTQYTGWSGLPTASNTSTQISWLPPGSLTALTAGTLYVRVRCKDNNNAWSAWSATQSFTVSSVPWADAPNGNGLKAQWMNDLANVINNARQFRGLSIFGFTDGTVTSSTDMKATHVTERRSKLNDVLSIVGVTPTWTDPTVDTTTDRSGQHVVDLRTYSSQT